MFSMVWRSLGIKKIDWLPVLGVEQFRSLRNTQRSPWQWLCVSWIQALLMRLHLPGTWSPAQPVPWSFLTNTNSSCHSWLLRNLSLSPQTSFKTLFYTSQHPACPLMMIFLTSVLQHHGGRDSDVHCQINLQHLAVWHTALNTSCTELNS